MKKKFFPICILAIISATLLLGCSGNDTETLSDEVEEIIEDTVEDASEEENSVEETAETDEDEERNSIEEDEAEEETEEIIEEVDVEEVGTVETVETTAAPQPVHTHTYVLTSSTAGANCQTVGTDTYTCGCGDSYTQANDTYGSHEYTTETTIETIHHPGQYEVIPTYSCDCGIYWTIDQYYECTEHCLKRDEGWGSDGSITKEISPAYDENIEHSRTYCVNCGIEQ